MQKNEFKSSEKPVFKIFKLIPTRLPIAESDEKDCFFIQEQSGYPIENLGYNSQLEAQIAIRDHSDALKFGEFVILPVFQVRHNY